MKSTQELWNQVRRIQLKTSQVVTDIFAGAYQSAFKGRGMQFEDVREYQLGDDVRSIDWNVTARMQYPYVKNFREERELTVMLAVDISRSCLFGSAELRKQDRLAEIASVLALSAIRNHDKIGLLLFSDQVESFIPPSKGMGHVMRLIRHLLTPHARGKLTDMDAALRHLFRIQPRRGICFLLSDFQTPPGDAAMGVAARRYDLINICLTDPSELDVPDVGLLPMRDLESGKFVMVDTASSQVRGAIRRASEARIQAAQQMSTRSGATFIDLRGQTDYVTELQRALECKEKRL